MQKITTNRLSSVLSALSTKKRAVQKSDTKVSKSEPNKKVKTRNKAALSQNIKTRLDALDRTSARFEAEATKITIQEIITWEFGNEILDHPEFKVMVNAISKKVSESDKLSKSLSETLNKLDLN